MIWGLIRTGNLLIEGHPSTSVSLPRSIRPIFLTDFGKKALWFAGYPWKENIDLRLIKIDNLNRCGCGIITAHSVNLFNLVWYKVLFALNLTIELSKCLPKLFSLLSQMNDLNWWNLLERIRSKNSAKCHCNSRVI